MQRDFKHENLIRLIITCAFGLFQSRIQERRYTSRYLDLDTLQRKLYFCRYIKYEQNRVDVASSYT